MEEELSLLRVLRWNKDGARQTAMLVGVIWFSSTKATTSRRKNRRIFKASLFSFGRRTIAAWTAWNCWSFGTSEDRKELWTLHVTCTGCIHQHSPKQGIGTVGPSISLSLQCTADKAKAIITVTSHKYSFLLLPVKMHIHTQWCWCLTCSLSILNTTIMDLSWTGSGYYPNKGLSPYKIWLWNVTLEGIVAPLSFPFSLRHEENRCSRITQFTELCLPTDFNSHWTAVGLCAQTAPAEGQDPVMHPPIMRVSPTYTTTKGIRSLLFPFKCVEHIKYTSWWKQHIFYLQKPDVVEDG